MLHPADRLLLNEATFKGVGERGAMRRYFLRKREARSLLKELAELGLSIEGPRGAVVEVAEARDGTKIFIINGVPLAAEKKGEKFPLLTAEDVLRDLPSLIVDMGAVPHICNGADIMAPGVVELRGDFGEGELVKVLDERHGKAIAIGRALFASEDMRGMRRGKVVKNLHYVGDKLWRLVKELSRSSS